VKGGVVQCNANELDLAIPSDCTMIFFIGWKGLLAFVILISVLDDAGGFDIWASSSSAILGLFSFVLCKAEGCGLPWVSSASWGRILVANHVLCYFCCCLLCIIFWFGRKSALRITIGLLLGLISVILLLD